MKSLPAIMSYDEGFVKELLVFLPEISWFDEIGGLNLLGGWHCDGYTVVVTGSPEAAYEFAIWYRGIVDYPICFYACASPGITLCDNMTVNQIKEAIDTQYSGVCL